MLGTVGRAGNLLDLFDAETPEWGATAVSRRLAITKSQAHEMLVSLEAIGLLRRAPGGRFRLGWKTVSLGQRLMRSELSAEGVRLIQRLGRHAEVSVDLVAFDGERCVRISGYGPSNHSRGPARETGRVSATGMVLLAGMPEGRAEELVPDIDVALEVAAARERGLAFEADEERRGVAAPVRGGDGSVFAALGVTVSPDVWSKKRAILTRGVAGTAKRLSQIMPGPGPQAFRMGEPSVPAPAAAAKIAA